MKTFLKIIIFLTFISFLTGFNISNIGNENPSSNLIIDGCHYGQCQATAASTGKQCKHCVSNPGDSYCWQHQ